MAGVINCTDHPVGTRLLYGNKDSEGGHYGCYEAVIGEWSAGGYVKLISKTDDEWCEWYHSTDIALLEVLPNEKGAA